MTEETELHRLSEVETAKYLLLVMGYLLWQASTLQVLMFVTSAGGLLTLQWAGLLGCSSRNMGVCFCYYLCVWQDSGLALFLPRFALRTC